MEDHLTQALELATCWKAIVLLDEADVFLEQRSVSDIHRNGLVSSESCDDMVDCLGPRLTYIVFLHLLEYYEGILFLTTNRIDRFDAAFKSRVHLAIKYHPLAFDSRRKLWRIFLNKACRDGRTDLMHDASLDKLAAEEINGRQIKNVVRTAYGMAVDGGEPLGFSQIETSLRAMRLFEAHIAEGIEREDAGSLTVDKRARKRKRGD